MRPKSHEFNRPSPNYPKPTPINPRDLPIDERIKMRDADPAETIRLAKEELGRRLSHGGIIQIPPSRFESSVPVGDLTKSRTLVLTPHNEKSATAVFYYTNDSGKEIGTTFTIRADGMIMGKIPKELEGARHLIEAEISDVISEIQIGMWHDVAFDGFVSEDERTIESTGAPIPDINPDEPRIDPERLAFLTSQRNILLGAYNGRLDDYHLIIFTKRPNEDGTMGLFAVLENPTEGNAAYVVDLSDDSFTPPEGFSHPWKFDQTEAEAMVRDNWDPISRQFATRKELRALPNFVGRVVHSGSDEQWQSRFQEVLDKLSR
jgi:hypothetical protein